MAAFLSNEIWALHDAALTKLATCVNLNFCSSLPANYAAIAAVSLAKVILTPGIGNGDYTKTDHKLTIDAHAGIIPTNNGDAIYQVLDDGVTLHWAQSMTLKTLSTTSEWYFPAFDVDTITLS